MPRARHSWRRWWSVGGAVAGRVLVCVVWAVDRDVAPTVYGYDVINAYPHDAHAYCQGLAFADGNLYEGTGQYGQSSLRRVELETGEVLQYVMLDRRCFGEGITAWRDRIIQLTWKGQFGIVYDRTSFAVRKRFRYAGQGWGLTHDGRHLIMSDGSSTLRFLDPETFRVVRRIDVRSQGRRVRDLNELEYVKGQILANIWYKDYIARIAPRTGEVTGWIDLRDLLPHGQRPGREAVLNGIAYDAEKDRLFVTGKNWPKLFEIRMKPKS
jgi:glutamine cyclotransferase